MQKPDGKKRKVVVVGAGDVGSTYCYALCQSGLAEEIVLIDLNKDLARGQILDLIHGQPFFPTVSLRVAQKAGETRLDLIRKNAAIMRSILADILSVDSPAILLVVSNPVDVMTRVALACSGWDRKRILGSGTVLDSARLRYLLASYGRIDVHNVHGYVLGEHGDSEFVAWSMTNVAGIPIDVYFSDCLRSADWATQRKRIEQEVRESAYHIIDYKGATNFAVGLALVRITAAVLRDQNSLLTVSTMLEGEFGLRDACLSVPCILSSRGVERVVESPLPEEELASLHSSAQTLTTAFEALQETS